MIYTITFNPAIDCALSVDGLRLGYTNKADSEIILAGGKGINVSIVLTDLGVENTALGFLAGFTGAAIKHTLELQGVNGDFIFLSEGNSRINVKINSGEETEINAAGPDIDTDSLQKLYSKLDNLSDGDYLVLAGSIPASLPDTTYASIMEYLEGRDLNIIVDAAGELLKGVLKYRPFLIKPNHLELGALFSRELSTYDEVLECAEELQRMGARNVLVSMAGDGAVFLGENGDVFTSAAPNGKIVNSVGAGDSMVAGFLAGLLRTRDIHKAVLMGISAGSASAFSDRLATADQVREIYSVLADSP